MIKMKHPLPGEGVRSRLSTNSSRHSYRMVGPKFWTGGMLARAGVA